MPDNVNMVRQSVVKVHTPKLKVIILHNSANN